MKQVDKDHYDFNKYSQVERWASYYYQLSEVLGLNPESILEVGVGDSVFGQYIKKNTGILYKSIDIAEDLNPDIVGSILSLPFNPDSFGVVCAFEVLEHIEFQKFETGLDELHRVCKKNVVISLPHFGPQLRFSLKVPFFKEIKILFKIPVPIEHVFKGEHYWEIGKKGYGFKKIRGVITKRFKIIKEFVPFENPYHRFYVLEKI